MQVGPQKEWVLPGCGYPLYGTGNDFVVVTRYGLVTALSSLRLMKPGVVHIEAAIVTLKRAVARIEVKGSDEGCSSVPSFVQQVGHVGQRAWKRNRELTGSMRLWVQASQDACVRSNGDGRLSVRMKEDNA